MIFETIHLPILYSIDREDLRADLKYGACIQILRDALENCLILYPVGQGTFEDINASLKRWPSTRSKKAIAVLMQLRNRNRFVAVSFDRHGGRLSARNSCCESLAITQLTKPDALIGPDICQRAPICAIESSRIITLENYAFSGFADERRNGLTCELRAGEWSKVEFEQRVWKRVFRHARHVRLFDRWVGRKTCEMIDKLSPTHVTALSSGQDFTTRDEWSTMFPANFERGLTWIFEQFMMHSRCGERFELTTEISPRNFSRQIPNRAMVSAGNILCQFADKLSASSGARKTGIRFDLKIKTGTYDSEMAHARFLVTDQIKLSIDPGFDLLDSRGNLRAVRISPAAEIDESESMTDFKLSANQAEDRPRVVPSDLH